MYTQKSSKILQNRFGLLECQILCTAFNSTELLMREAIVGIKYEIFSIRKDKNVVWKNKR